MADPASPIRSGGIVVLVLKLGLEAESRKLLSSRFKGVVPKSNGKWGAHIYDNHKRMWLVIFNEEDGVARAYETAVKCFRGAGAVTNFKPLLLKRRRLLY
ncbi:hypothetical protein L1987_71576 [Smallanthus sonchifolius]|uniref:Uncharacterized protein n=1 Tax=Smallanthus sonchifolius TaxID=185202 RepID=A0ACB9AU62_9ASTR|nr:hypothetical protein L1987_71576 [Smallanthus sonchifolius]